MNRTFPTLAQLRTHRTLMDFVSRSTKEYSPSPILQARISDQVSHFGSRFVFLSFLNWELYVIRDRSVSEFYLSVIELFLLSKEVQAHRACVASRCCSLLQDELGSHLFSVFSTHGCIIVYLSTYWSTVKLAVLPLLCTLQPGVWSAPLLHMLATLYSPFLLSTTQTPSYASMLL